MDNRESTNDPEAVRQMMDQFQRRRRYEKRPLSSGELLSRLIASRGFSQELFNDELQQVWQNAVGSRFSGKTMATTIRRGTLEIIVSSSPARQQLGFMKTGLLRQLQKQLPDAGIRSLRFRVGTIPE